MQQLLMKSQELLFVCQIDEILRIALLTKLFVFCLKLSGFVERSLKLLVLAVDLT